ncbi:MULTISPECIES: hypothetical protein [Paenibacillus]|jgi:hypothetical protein|nr:MULTISPECIES: hypothetical protein [Paenibacillus]MBY0013227.1 hypothetical protein [Paenibacillus typhae]MDF9842007.1 hypothetical protein [Paenibacillus sp. PastF-2]MDF9848739.1 hypothetical protein [Paenibacillus sp. PastM-2]MDF9855309.1 hypothetical protein [Paenibacillus sp. PastF-1]MDH6480579.1 hypothetical protein [Paenibacillus sp. PastH-2]
MKKDSISVAMFLAIGFVIAGIFITAATHIIGGSQDDIIEHTKQVEQY